MDFDSINTLTDLLNYNEEAKEDMKQTQTFVTNDKVKFALDAVNELDYNQAGIMLKTLATHLRNFHDEVVCDDETENKEPWIVDLIRLENVCKILEDFG